MFERVERRTKVTGRVVPRELLLETMQQIPSSLRILAPYVDYVATFANEDDTAEPVLLWSSKRPSSSSNDLSKLATFGAPNRGARIGGRMGAGIGTDPVVKTMGGNDVSTSSDPIQ